MIRLRILDLPADRMEGEAVAALFFEDDRPLRGPASLLDWRLNSLLTELLVQGKSVGRTGERILVRSNGKIGSEWILFAGGGNRRDLVPEAYGELIRGMIEASLGAGFLRVALCLAPMAGLDSAAIESMVSRIVANVSTRDGQEPEILLSIENKGISHPHPRHHGGASGQGR
jgi:hypothetical protein